MTASTNPYVVFNTVSPNNNKALTNVKVRQALEFAINRTNIIQVLGGPKINPPLTHVLPPGIIGARSSSTSTPTTPDKAKQMLAEAGYPNGLTLKFLYRNASEGSSKAFQTVQQDLSKVGVTVVGVPSPNADFYAKYLQVPDRRPARRLGPVRWPAGAPTGTATRPCRSSTRCSPASRRSRRSAATSGSTTAPRRTR